MFIFQIDELGGSFLIINAFFSYSWDEFMFIGSLLIWPLVFSKDVESQEYLARSKKENLNNTSRGNLFFESKFSFG